MTRDDTPKSPLRRARERVGWTQGQARRRFAQAVRDHGGQPPSDESLKRMFAYWENGSRAVTLPLYRRAFERIYQTSAELLGFAPADDTGRIEQLRTEAFDLYDVDAELVDLFESQTQGLRMLDRRLGTTGLAAQAQLHVTQIGEVLRRSIGGQRPQLARALAAAAGLAGWQMLDRGDVRASWDLHDVARTAAQDCGDPVILAHVTAQSGNVLLDAGKPQEAGQLVAAAREQLDRRTPALVGAWLAAADAETAAAAGDTARTHQQLDAAATLLDRSDSGVDEFPYLMLNTAHLARWRGHCLARLGETEAIDYLTAALDGAGDSVRAATGLHVDLAYALHRAGKHAAARDQVATATDMADRYGSARQRARLRRLLPQG